MWIEIRSTVYIQLLYPELQRHQLALNYAKMNTQASSIFISLLLLPFLICVVLGQSDGDGITVTCPHLKLVGISTLQYSCITDDGSRKAGKLDLNQCFTNVDGFLLPVQRLVDLNTTNNNTTVDRGMTYTKRYSYSHPEYSGGFSTNCTSCEPPIITLRLILTWTH